MTDQPDNSQFDICEREPFERASRILSSLRCLESLLGCQVPMATMSPEPIANLLSLLNDEVEKLLPLERMTRRPRPMNDAN